MTKASAHPNAQSLFPESSCALRSVILIQIKSPFSQLHIMTLIQQH